MSQRIIRFKMVKFRVLLCVFSFILRAHITNCCSPCQCTGWKEIDCSNLGLTEVPDSLIGLTFTSLQLDNNNITNITYLKHFEKLDSLSIKDNSLNSLTADQFPEGLRSLDASGNRLSYVNLTGLDSLQTLAVDLINVTGQPFDGLTSLRTLMVKLVTTSFTGDIFDDCCGALQFLKINFTHASEISDRLMCPFQHLLKLFVVGNDKLSLPEYFLKPNCSSGQKHVTVENLTITTFNELSSGLLTSTTIELDALKIQHVNSIPDDLLREKDAMTNLDMSYNDLKSIPRDWFKDIRNVEEVNFSHNKITTLYQGMFGSQIKKLTKLDLSHNKIVSVPEGALQVLKNGIRHLDISHNPIKNLSKFSFAKLTALETLNLSHANLESMAMVQPIHDIKTLHLQNNRISHFPDKLYLDNLEHLELQNNHLNLLPPEILSKFTSLKHLNVHNNSIFCLTDDTFAEQYELEYLDLSWNNLEFLSDKMFDSLEYLEYLNLSHNNFQDVSLGTFNPLYSIRVLNLTSNNITKVTVNEDLNLRGPTDIDLRNNIFLCNCSDLGKGLANIVIHCPDPSPFECIEAPIHTRKYDNKCNLVSSSLETTMGSIFTTQSVASSRTTENEYSIADVSNATLKTTTGSNLSVDLVGFPTTEVSERESSTRTNPGDEKVVSDIPGTTLFPSSSIESKTETEVTTDFEAVTLLPKNIRVINEADPQDSQETTVEGSEGLQNGNITQTSGLIAAKVSTPTTEVSTQGAEVSTPVAEVSTSIAKFSTVTTIENTLTGVVSTPAADVSPVVAEESIPVAADFSMSTEEVSTVAEKESTSAVEVMKSAAQVATPAAEVRTAAAEVSTDIAEVSSSAVEINTSAAEMSTLVAEVSKPGGVASTLAAEVSMPGAEVSSVAAEVSTSATEVHTSVAEVSTPAGIVSTVAALVNMPGAGVSSVAAEVSSVTVELSTLAQISTQAAEVSATTTAVSTAETAQPKAEVSAQTAALHAVSSTVTYDSTRIFHSESSSEPDRQEIFEKSVTSMGDISTHSDEEIHNMTYPTCVSLLSNSSSNISMNCSLPFEELNVEEWSDQSLTLLLIVCGVIFAVLALVAILFFVARKKGSSYGRSYYTGSKAEYI